MSLFGSRTSKREGNLAYKAGRNMPAEGVVACPFPEGDPRRRAWLQGYADAMGAAPNPAATQKQVAAALEKASA